ncbi:MAG: hypothetical protein ACRD0P_30530, partial [Stackebrandtia sp.]
LTVPGYTGRPGHSPGPSEVGELASHRDTNPQPARGGLFTTRPYREAAFVNAAVPLTERRPG